MGSKAWSHSTRPRAGTDWSRAAVRESRHPHRFVRAPLPLASGLLNPKFFVGRHPTYNKTGEMLQVSLLIVR